MYFQSSYYLFISLIIKETAKCKNMENNKNLGKKCWPGKDVLSILAIDKKCLRYSRIPPKFYVILKYFKALLHLWCNLILSQPPYVRWSQICLAVTVTKRLVEVSWLQPIALNHYSISIHTSKHYYPHFTREEIGSEINNLPNVTMLIHSRPYSNILPINNYCNPYVYQNKVNGLMLHK